MSDRANAIYACYTGLEYDKTEINVSIHLTYIQHL